MQRFFTGGIHKVCLLFLFYNQISGELVLQAERKVQPSTHIPDLDNANVGIFVSNTGNFQIGVFPCFILGGDGQSWLKSMEQNWILQERQFWSIWQQLITIPKGSQWSAMAILYLSHSTILPFSKMATIWKSSVL